MIFEGQDPLTLGSAIFGADEHALGTEARSDGKLLLGDGREASKPLQVHGQDIEHESHRGLH